MNLTRRVVIVAVLVALAATACRANAEPVAVSNAGSQMPELTGAPRSETTSDASALPTPSAGGGVDFRLTREDIACDRASMNVVYPEMFFVLAHVVVDGDLGAPCFGEPDPRLIEAWDILATITPPSQLRSLATFGGFVSNESDQTTLAYVNFLHGDEIGFRMSVNLTEAEIDRDELMLTMAHEFAHVLTTQADQIDRSLAPGECETWHNLGWCYAPDSLMWDWIQQFWDEGRIDLINPKLERSTAAGEDLCTFDPSFLGPYAASHPEEDFAQAFSAFVFRVEQPSPELDAKMEWFARRPELAVFRNRAIEAGLGPLRRSFLGCG